MTHPGQKLIDMRAHSYVQLAEMAQNHDVYIERRALIHGGGYIVTVSLDTEYRHKFDDVVEEGSLQEAIGRAWLKVTAIETEMEQDDTCSDCDGSGIGHSGDPDTSRCHRCHGAGVLVGDDEGYMDE